MTILEKLQSAKPGTTLGEDIEHIVWQIEQKDKQPRWDKWLKDGFINGVIVREDPFTQSGYTEEEYQTIIDKVKERLDAASTSNNELLHSTLGLAGGDDYDGCFTFFGLIEYNCFQNELERRLIECGFLSEQGICDFGNHDDFGL